MDTHTFSSPGKQKFCHLCEMATDNILYLVKLIRLARQICFPWALSVLISYSAPNHMKRFKDWRRYFEESEAASN